MFWRDEEGMATKEKGLAESYFRAVRGVKQI